MLKDGTSDPDQTENLKCKENRTFSNWRRTSTPLHFIFATSLRVKDRVAVEGGIAQSVRAFPLHAEGLVFESRSPQTKIGSDSSTAKCSATIVSVKGPRRRPLCTDIPCHSRYGKLKTSHCQVSSWDENLQSLIGNGDVSIWVNFDRVRGDTKQLKHACLFFCSQVSELVIYWTISLVPRSFKLLQKLSKPILNNPPRAYSVFTSNWKNVEWCLSSFLAFNHHLFFMICKIVC